MRQIVSPLEGVVSPFKGRKFSPRALLLGAAAFLWLDPSDLSTLFQDTAGTTPVTAAGQSVGRILDKSGRGNHATQSVFASRPIYGVEPSTGRRNLLTYSEDWTNGGWVKIGVTVAPNAVAAPNGSLAASQLVEGTSNSTHLVSQTPSFTPSDNATVTISVYVKAAGRDFFWLEARTKSTAAPPTAYFNLATGVVVATYNGASATITAVGDGWYRCTLTANVLTGAETPQFTCGPSVAANFAGRTYLGDGSSGVYLWGAQYEVGGAATVYQKVVSQYDVTEAGVSSRSYLSFDGIDDFLVTPTITPGTDKVQVFAGVRKLSDAAAGLLVEFSAAYATNSGVFTINAPTGATQATYGWGSKGISSAFVTSPATFGAPITSVLTGLGDIAGDTSILRINGTQAATSAADQGTGNYLANPLYIGRRGGTTLPFNGRLYGLITRFGPNLTDDQISQAERWMAQRTGVTL